MRLLAAGIVAFMIAFVSAQAIHAQSPSPTATPSPTTTTTMPEGAPNTGFGGM